MARRDANVLLIGVGLTVEAIGLYASLIMLPIALKQNSTSNVLGAGISLGLLMIGAGLLVTGAPSKPPHDELERGEERSLVRPTRRWFVSIVGAIIGLVSLFLPWVAVSATRSAATASGGLSPLRFLELAFGLETSPYSGFVDPAIAAWAQGAVLGSWVWIAGAFVLAVGCLLSVLQPFISRIGGTMMLIGSGMGGAGVAALSASFYTSSGAQLTIGPTYGLAVALIGSFISLYAPLLKDTPITQPNAAYVPTSDAALALDTQRKPTQSWQLSRPPIFVQKPTTAFVLSLLGGIFIVLGGLSVGIFAFDLAAGITIGAIGVCFGFIVIFDAVMVYLRPEHRRSWGISILVFSILSVFPALGGFVIGMILGILGGVLATSWSPPGAMTGYGVYRPSPVVLPHPPPSSLAAASSTSMQLSIRPPASCSSCGALLLREAAFCSNCGARV